MFSGSKKIILCVTNQQLIAGIWHGSTLVSYRVFLNRDEDHTAFNEFLFNYKQLQIYLIADAIEEDYKLEALPHTSGRARKEILERKLGQFNRTSTYRTAHFINRATDKRKDDYFLFIALSNSDFLQSWMDVIQAAHAPLVGVYLLPMISQVMVRQMKLMAPNILLCERLSSGLRQTFLHNGRLRMSRLAPMEKVKPNQLAYFYLVEIEKTRLYLLSQRQIGAETPLQMLLPAFDDTHEVIATSISQEQGFECKAVDVLAYAKNINLKPELVKTHPELLHMQLLANGNVPDNLAPETLTKTYNIFKLSKYLYIAMMLIIVSGILLASYYLWQGYQQKQQIAEVAAEAQQFLTKYESVAKNFPETPIPGSDLKTAAEISAIVKKNEKKPESFMLILSSALEQFPNVSLNRMRWVLTDDIEIKDEADLKREFNGNTQTNPPVNADITTLRQVGFINAEIKGFAGDYRAALATVSRLATMIRNQPAVEQVTVLQEPVNVSSLADLKGSTLDESSAERSPATFKLKVVLKASAQEQVS